MKYSILDLAPVGEGSDIKTAFQTMIRMAQMADGLGYHRYWLAEHHNMPGIASAATSILIDQVAQHTTRLRVGSGGVMLPNHSPLAIAEQFGTLAVLHGDRIDLGIGRAPGGDGNVIRALRRSMDPGDHFPQDVVELLTYFGPADPKAPVRAVPGQDTNVPVWILGSSLYGAQLAAYLGLPYAFASHFAPAALDEAVAIYRSRFQPSKWSDKPNFMLAVNVIVADSDEQAQYLRTSQIQQFARLRSGAEPGQLPPPTQDLDAVVPARMRQGAEQALSVSAIGTADSVHRQLQALVSRYQPDEIIATGQIYDPDTRIESFRRADAVFAAL